MQTTEAEMNLAIMEWQSKYKPLWFAETENNFRLMYAALRNRVLSRAPIDAEKIRDIVENFNKYGQSNGVRGRLDVVQTSVASTDALNEVPWADEPLLRTVISLQAVRDLTSTQLKMLSSRWPWDANGNEIVPISTKFEQRLAWLKAHPDVDPSAVAEAIERVLGNDKPQQPRTVVIRKTEDPRIQALRAKIDEELKGYTNWAIKKRERLHQTLNEILRDSSRQVYRDRSRGAIEVLKGIDAIERLIADAINDAVNGSIQ